jgi:hypothetical protein
MATGSMFRVDFRTGEVVILRSLREDHSKFLAAKAVGKPETEIVMVQERRHGQAPSKAKHFGKRKNECR